MQRTARYTTGARIENHFLDLLELIYKAYYSPLENKSGKFKVKLNKAITGVSEGQAIVLYKGKEVLGGGEIEFG